MHELLSSYEISFKNYSNYPRQAPTMKLKATSCEERFSSQIEQSEGVAVGFSGTVSIGFLK